MKTKSRLIKGLLILENYGYVNHSVDSFVSACQDNVCVIHPFYIIANHDILNLAKLGWYQIKNVRLHTKTYRLGESFMYDI